MTSLVNWVKANPLVAGLIAILLLILIFTGNGWKKSDEKFTSMKTTLDTTKTQFASLSKEYSDYKKNYNQDLEWVSEPVLDKDGRPLLDGHGKAIFRKRLSKKTDASSNGSATASQTVTQFVEVVHTESVTVVQEKKVESGRQYRVVINMGTTLDFVNPSQVFKSKFLLGADLRVIRSLGLNTHVTFPLDFKKEGVELYLGPAIFW